MATAYLKIENPGVAPAEAFTLLGASAKRESELEYKGIKSIGTFGSGAKMALALLLRNGLEPVIFASNLKMSFSIHDQEIQDDIDSSTHGRIQVKYGGKDEWGTNRSATEMLGFVVGYGVMDWKSVALALREYISNALDHSLKYNRHNGTDEQYPWDGTNIEVVDERQVRAKKGYTRVFVPLNPAVLDFYNNLGKWFLHFSSPDLLNQSVFAKAGRNLREGDHQAVIYRRGVRVREFRSSRVPSLFDYNLEHLVLDESRQAQDWDVQQAAAAAVRDASSEHLETLFRSFQTETFWEHEFPSYGLNPAWDDNSETKKLRSEAWNRAFTNVYGENGVVVTKGGGDHVKRKGYNPVELPEVYCNAASVNGIRSPESVLTIDEKEGREIFPAVPDALAAVKFIWGHIEELNLTYGKSFPKVESFRQMMNGESVIHGFFRDGTVFLNEDLGENAYLSGGFSALSNELLVTAAEEVGHYITEATDNSRDFQEWFIQLSVRLMRK